MTASTTALAAALLAIAAQAHATTNSDSAESWQAHCAGRSGEDVSKAKYALP